MARGLTDAERYFQRIESLGFSVLPTRDLSLVATASEHHDGVMVALIPVDPDQLALDGDDALPADDLHVTLTYHGKVQDLTTFDKTEILSKTRHVCDAVGKPFSTSADGVIVMGKNKEGVPATALLLQADEIVELYEALAEALGYESDYPTFIPHMTTGYGVPVEAAEERVGQPIAFNSVIVKFGDTKHVIPLHTALVASPSEGANVIDRVVDSLGRLWDEALHPRDGEGRFIKKNGAISGKLFVPKRGGKGVDVVPANRASVVGFKTIDNEVWVLAEITNPDGSKSQGFAKAVNVRAVAPVKARLDALYPVDGRGDAFLNSALERRRQLDLLLSHIGTEFGPDNDKGALAFVESLGLWEKDLDYLWGGDDPDYLGGLRKVDHPLNDGEQQELDDIISDARNVKELRQRVHGLQEDADFGFSAKDAHVPPEQQLVVDNGADPEVVAALNDGADPFTLTTSNLLGAMYDSDRFERQVPQVDTGVSPIEWLTDSSDQTGNSVGLAGMHASTTDRAYFVKESVVGAELANTDIVREVLASLIAEQIGDAVGSDDDRLIPVPKSVFGDNPEWDGGGIEPGAGDFSSHQPAHVVSQHAGYLVPSDWEVTDAQTEGVAFWNDIKNLDYAAQVDQREAFNEDMGDLYGNSVAKMVLFDFLILNGDRNAANALLAAPPDGGEGRALPIDHGFAFDKDPFENLNGEESTFEWFMQYQLTRAWMDYVLGGLALNNNVSEDTLQQVLNDFIDVYGNIDADKISAAFQEIPGVTDEQIQYVEEWLSAAVDRMNWMVDNTDTVLNALTGRK